MSLTDKILGRQDLKDRIKKLEGKIQSLEGEKEKLKEQAEKERERAKEAVSKKQELNEKINRQEDKIQSLKDKLRKKEFVEDNLNQGPRPDRISKERLRKLVGKLKGIESGEEDLLSVFLPPGVEINRLDTEGVIQTSLTLNQLKRLKEEGSETGKAFFYTDDLISLMVKPPIPIDGEDWFLSNRFKVSPLEGVIDGKIGFIFLSANGSAVAVFDDEVKDFRKIGGDIKSKHKKGGFSQDRFERGRKEEVKKHIREVEGVCQDFFSDDIEKIALSGSEDMVNKFNGCDFLNDKSHFERKLNLSEITDRSDMERAFSEFWKAETVKI